MKTYKKNYIGKGTENANITTPKQKIRHQILNGIRNT